MTLMKLYMVKLTGEAVTMVKLPGESVDQICTYNVLSVHHGSNYFHF